MSVQEIRQVRKEDAQAILEIYRPYIEETSITFEYDVPSLEAFEARIDKISKEYAYLVYTMDGVVKGYAYAARHRERAAYNWNVELSIYLDRSMTHQGVGAKLYEALLEVLKAQQIYNVYGCMTCPNEASEKLHQKLGFETIGTFTKTGYKFGKWHSTKFFEKCLGDRSGAPQPVCPIGEVDAQIIKQILESAL